MVSLLLAGLMCLAPFLVPYHQPPMHGFYGEWLAAALGLSAVVAALSGRRFAPVLLPLPALWLLGFAVFLILRALIVQPAYWQMTFWAVIYVVLAVVVVWLGAQLASTLGREQAGTVIAAFILAGALANALAGIVQFYGRPGFLHDFVAVLRGHRAYGNIAQPNLFANYLALGEAALLYLWVRKSLGTAVGGIAAALLAWACALSGSRIALLIPLWFIVLGLALRARSRGADSQRLLLGSCLLAAASWAFFALLPALNSAAGVGPPRHEALDRLLAASGDTRWEAWALALRMFFSAPISGTGIGEFAGAAFEAGLPGGMARQYQVWTSPHNLIFHLLAETGLLGAGLVLIAWGLWWWQSWRVTSRERSPVAWWILACVGVEFINSMLEYPMWSAHFLLLTALLMGIGGVVSSPPPVRATQYRFIAAATAAVFVAVLAGTARDYGRLDVVRVTGTSRTLAGTATSDDAATLIALGSGPLGPVADLWRCLGVALDRQDLAAKLELSSRVMRYWPSQAIVTRRAILLALAGRGNEAVLLVSRVAAVIDPAAMTLLRQARETDPEAIDPLLAAIGVRP